MATGFENKRRSMPSSAGGGVLLSPKALTAAKPPEVLIVEDDESLWPVLEFLVEEAAPGRPIARARSSEEAIAWLKHGPAQASIRLVITDLFIAGTQNGVDLWRNFGAADRSFLVISGAAREAFEALVTKHEAPLFFRKPLDLDQCGETIKLMLANPGWY